MYRMSVLYMNKADATFDMAYYVSKHMPMVHRHLGSNLIRYEVVAGLPGPNATPPPMLAAGHLYVKDLAAVGQTIAAHSAEIFGDIKNYTNIQPLVVNEQVTYP